MIMYNREFTPLRLKGLKENEVWVMADSFPGISDGVCRRSKEVIAHLEIPELGVIWRQHYFIPLMKEGVKALKPYVDEFIVFAAKHKEYKFIVLPVGCGFVGFDQIEVALLFEKAIEVENIILPKNYVNTICAK